MPSNLNMDSHTWRLFDDLDVFAKTYIATSLGTSKRPSYIKERIIGVNFAIPKDFNLKLRIQSGNISKEEIEALNIADWNNFLFFSLPRMADSGPTFNTNQVLETFTHEFGHSLARAIDFNFGNSSSDPAIKKAYAQVKKDFISQYGESSYHEHFAEAFSSYVSTGKAPESWIAFMKQAGIIKG